MNTIVEFKNITKRFQSKVILENIDLSIQSGKIYSLVGASGSGKTTALRLMNGLIRPEQGEIHFENSPLDYRSIVSIRRKMGYCIQGSGLFPHMTVFENISLIARRLKHTPKEILERSESLMEMVHLSPSHYFTKKPLQLSGGEKQRVGIVRALMLKPKLLLMDEPFGALDPIIRRDLQNQFLELQSRLHATVIFVTHDIQEAFKMSDELILLYNGGIEQLGSPRELIEKPVSPYVTKFLKANAPLAVLKDIFHQENPKGKTT